MKVLKSLFYVIRAIFFIPHYFFFLFKKNSHLRLEVSEWSKKLDLRSKNVHANFFILISLVREFRSVFYFRSGILSKLLLSWYAPGTINLFILGNISSPLFIIHGHSSYIHPLSMGKNCQIWHNVTIGKKEQGKGQLQPRIGNNVRICTGAIVLGNITIGDNVTIGAGSIVIKDVPPNCVVAGNPAKILKQINK